MFYDNGDHSFRASGIPTCFIECWAITTSLHLSDYLGEFHGLHDKRWVAISTTAIATETANAMIPALTATIRDGRSVAR
jgi:hypothetical protein